MKETIEPKSEKQGHKLGDHGDPFSRSSVRNGKELDAGNTDDVRI